MLAPIVSKIFCSSSTTVLMIRKRPPVANGGGFVVVDSDQKAVFGVDGCGILGVDNKLIVRDGDGAPLLFISSKVGGKEMTRGDDFYCVVVQPGFDQAFVVGVIAVLDKIHGESTRC
ncbi:Protein LURP-one-related 16 [Platanthera zijinensis]|uniref:Protein LURP-one-related 16 n=1 Tax=Platanthera zijinensis TaxID=2320716 RepID=A0AAP0B740_9ASPA